MKAPACDTENLSAGAKTSARDAKPEIRVDKVRAIRRQLRKGTYRVAERLGVVVERIIKDLA